MFSTFMDLSKAGNWIIKDNASKFFSTESRLFYYNIEASNDKIYDMVFDTIAKYVAMLSEESYQQFLSMYVDVLPYLKKWITIGNASVDVAVNKDEYPTSMLTKTTVFLDMDIKDIKDVVDILIEKADDRDKIKAMIDVGNPFIRDRNGDTGRISADFDIILDEKFSYDEESCSLDNVDADLYLETDAENSERAVYHVAKECALPDGEELDGNNEIKVSEGDDGTSEP